MKVVCNASPLVHLARISQIRLLHQVYGEILIPDAVWQEVVVQGAGKPGADEVRLAPWIKKQDTNNRLLVSTLQRDLDAGESEAIVLALEVAADVLLMDEQQGRETATYLGLHCVGLIGTLIAAKNHGYIDSVKPMLDTLRLVARFRVSNALYQKVLQDLGEI